MTDSYSEWPDFISSQNLLAPASLRSSQQDSSTPYIASIVDQLSPSNDSHRSLEMLEVSGTDALKFLQGQVTCDMTQVKENQCQLAACINLKGRVISNFIVMPWSRQDAPSYLLLCPPEMSSITAAVLKKYAVFSKVSIDIADKNLLVSMTNAPLSEIKAIAINAIEAEPQTSMHWLAIPGSQRHLFLAPSHDMLALWKQLKHFQYVRGYDSWQQENINDALVFIEKPCSEMFTVQEINFELVKGVNFSKGCYTGQEIVARLHYRGVSKRRAFIAEIQIPVSNNPESNQAAPPFLESGSEIFNDENRSVGHLLTKNDLGNNCFVALVSLSLEAQKKFHDKSGESVLQFTNPSAIISKLAFPPYSLEKI